LLSNDYKTAVGNGNDYVGGRANKSHTSGKWYFEVHVVGTGIPYPTTLGGSVGVTTTTRDLSGWAVPGIGVGSWGFALSNGQVLHDGIYNSPNPGCWHDYGNPVDFGDYVGCAVDLDANKIWWSINGVWQADGNPTFGLNAFFQEMDIASAAPHISVGYGEATYTLSDYSDATYAPPEGFYYWDYEAPRNETMVICRETPYIDLSAYKTVISFSGDNIEETSNIFYPGNIRLLNFRALIGD
jgi:hypothetical protein